jgi:hypothetical protein
MLPDNTGPRAEVPESTPHTGPLADTHRAAHPVALVDHTQALSTEAKTFDGSNGSLGGSVHEHQN